MKQEICAFIIGTITIITFILHESPAIPLAITTSLIAYTYFKLNNKLVKIEKKLKKK